MSRLGHLAPANHDRTDDHQVITDDGKVRPATVGAKQTKPLVHRNRPDRLAGLTIEALEIAADTECIDASAGRVAGDAAPADSCVGHIREPDIEAVFPDRLAADCIQADHSLALSRRLRLGPAEHVDLAIHHDRRTSSANIFSLPTDITALAAGGIPVIDQPGFCRGAIKVGAAPVGPVLPDLLVSCGRLVLQNPRHRCCLL